MEGNKDGKAGMVFLMAWSFWGIIGLYFAKIYRDREIEEEEIIIG
jgi:hypothetical protein